MDIQKAYIARKKRRTLNKKHSKRDTRGGTRKHKTRNTKTKRRGYGMHSMNIQKAYLARKI